MMAAFFVPGIGFLMAAAVRPLPAPHPPRDRSLAMLAPLGVLALAAARGGDLLALEAPASLKLVGAYLALGALDATRAVRAVLAGPARI
jgi:hypothetical protein